MHCCSSGEPAATAIAPHTPSNSTCTWLASIKALTQWALPITTLALMPKCPGCVAGYVLLLTGIGVSFTAATAMRWSLIAISIVALAYLTFRMARRACTLITQHT